MVDQRSFMATCVPIMRGMPGYEFGALHMVPQRPNLSPLKPCSTYILKLTTTSPKWPSPKPMDLQAPSASPRSLITGPMPTQRRLKVIPHRYTLREVRVEAGWKMFRPNKLCCRTAAVAECPDTPRSANIRFNSPGYVGIHHSEGIAIARETKCFHCAICPLSPDCPGDWH